MDAGDIQQAIQRVNADDTSRLKAFADGVLAIAATLLVIEIHLPEQAGEGTPLTQLLVEEWSSYLAYIIGFITIAIMWINHHNFMKMIDSVDTRFLLLNAILLALITFLNYPTAILARYLATPEAPIAVAVYGANVLIVALGYQALLRYAAHRRQLIAPEIEMAQIASVQREYNTGFALYAFAFALSFVSVVLALAMHIGLAVFFVVTASGERAANKAVNARSA